MLFVADTSALIVLQKLGLLSLCDQGDNKFICPPSVTRELKRQRRKNRNILDLLKSGAIGENRIQKFMTIGGISETDIEVISLAVEHNVTILSEDILLRQKAIRLGLPAISIGLFVVQASNSGLFSKNECFSHLSILYKERFLSKKEYRLLLQGIVP